MAWNPASHAVSYSSTSQVKLLIGVGELPRIVVHMLSFIFVIAMPKSAAVLASLPGLDGSRARITFGLLLLTCLSLFSETKRCYYWFF